MANHSLTLFFEKDMQLENYSQNDTERNFV